MNNEVLVPNMHEVGMTAIHLIHSAILAADTKVADFTITEELLTSCNHASNRYWMHFMDKKTEEEETERGRKRKDLEVELVAAKKRKKELEATVQKLIASADTKAKEAEEQNEVVIMKSLLLESNASRQKSQVTIKKEIPKQDDEIKEINEKPKLLD